MVYIGIDLGTTYSCVAIVENSRPVAIHNADDSKRLIGWHVLHDLPIAEDRQLWTFNAATRNNCAGYILNRGTLNERFIRPEEVSAEILKSMKARAEKYTSQKVIEAVVTVPAMFNSDQIMATKKAIELAGLKLRYLLQEPTAAAIAYNEKKKLGNSKLLVFDLGGDYDIYKKPKLLKRLRIECRKAKESLSFSNNPVNVHLDINDNLEINVKLTKEKLHELCSDLFEKAMIFVDRALNMAQLSPEKIDHVILVGGSTRIPQIEQNIRNKFPNSKIQFDINPDEAIAHGAAIIADALEV
ncbi:hypothetical protein WR25_24736 [Diploscapter pachys]|uniref:Hsp70 family protein n=1 Tax=Diploscapter pachys TaxID=2018661 RepID=A0A2A2L1T0_9BILA|nr:hypothetical protein WR25_24736 [Diploscapter pachys]